MAKDIICPNCQQPTSADASFCGNCGRQLSSPVASATTQNASPPTEAPANQPNQTTVAPANSQPSATNSASAAPAAAASVSNTATNSPSAAPAQTPTTNIPSSTTNPPNQPITTTKDTFFKLPRLPKAVSILIIIVFSLFTLIFLRAIFRTEEIYGNEQPTEGQTREQFINTMRVYGIVFTSISSAIVAFGVVCYKHPRLKK